MRELVLNGASARADSIGEAEVERLLVAVAKGIARLVSSKHAAAELRAVEPLTTIQVGSVGVWDLLVSMLRSRRNTEEVIFLMGIAHRTPLLAGVREEICGTFYSAAHEDGLVASEGVVFCAITMGVAVSLATSEQWSGDTIPVRLVVLTEGAELERREEAGDNVCGEETARSIEGPARSQLMRSTGTREFWDNRAAMFPNLSFGLDVESQVERLDEATFLLVRSRLDELDATVAQWRDEKTPAPQYRSYVTPESASTMSTPSLVRARTFRSSAGAAQVYEWHARFGGGGRIHFVADAALRSIEVGYMGPHLPL